jgi:hypothetical protein
VLSLILECGETAHRVLKDNTVLWDTTGRGNPTGGFSVQTSIRIIVSEVKIGCEQGRGPDLWKKKIKKEYKHIFQLIKSAPHILFCDQKLVNTLTFGNKYNSAQYAQIIHSLNNTITLILNRESHFLVREYNGFFRKDPSWPKNLALLAWIRNGLGFAKALCKILTAWLEVHWSLKW